jgi:hypothetical protein
VSEAPPAEDDEARYATLLEEVFIAERGTPFLLSPKDWLLIRGWRERGIPADTVVRAIRETFERRRARGAAGKISSISYCANSVDERWEMERRGLVGKRDAAREAPAGSAAGKLAALAGALEAAAETLAEERRAAAGRAAEKVRALPADGAWDDLEESLLSIEGSLGRALEKALSPEEAEDLERRVAADLGEMRGVASSVVERTRRALRRRELRRRNGLPPLSLF